MTIIDTSRIKNEIQKRIKNVILNCVSPVGSWSSKKLELDLQTMFNAFEHQGTIRSFTFDRVEFVEGKPLREVDCLPITTCPGDSFIAEGYNDDGSKRDEFRGIVISTDGEGGGTILTPPDACGGEIIVRCRFQPFFPVEFISLEVKVDV